jgi:phosphate-selective porin OprO/OprP
MNFKLRSLVAATLAGSMLMGFGANAMADSTDDILNALIAKGVLTEEEGALLLKGRTGEKEAAEAKKKTAISAKVKDGAVVFESGDGKNSMAVTGRMHLDYRNVDAKGAPANGTGMAQDTDTAGLADSLQVRRARIGVKGKLYDYFDYELQANLVGSDTNIVDVAYVNAGMYKPMQLRVGQFKQPFNLEEQTSSNNIDFMERSYVNQLSPSKKPGAMIHGIPSAGLTYAASVYQHNAFGETDSDTDGKGFAGRATVNFSELAGWNDSVFHVGLAGFDSEYGVVPTNSNNTTKNPEQHTRGTIFSMRTEGRGLTNIYRAQIAGDMLPSSGNYVGSDSKPVEVAAGYGLRSNTSAVSYTHLRAHET